MTKCGVNCKHSSTTNSKVLTLRSLWRLHHEVLNTWLISHLHGVQQCINRRRKSHPQQHTDPTSPAETHLPVSSKPVLSRRGPTLSLRPLLAVIYHKVSSNETIRLRHCRHGYCNSSFPFGIHAYLVLRGSTNNGYQQETRWER